MTRICIKCGSDKTYVYKGLERWYSGGHICHKCHNRLYWSNNPDKAKARNDKWNPIYNPKWNPINNAKSIGVYIGSCFKIIKLNHKPRTGQCQSCFMKVDITSPSYKNRTFTHRGNNEFDPNDPLKDTIELCSSCHFKANWKEGAMIK